MSVYRLDAIDSVDVFGRLDPEKRVGWILLVSDDLGETEMAIHRHRLVRFTPIPIEYGRAECDCFVTFPSAKGERGKVYFGQSWSRSDKV